MSLMCIAVAVFFEAQGEEFDGKLAVAQVIQNRVETSFFPDNACDVISQPYAFSYTHDGLSDDPFAHIENEEDMQAWNESMYAAEMVLYGNIDGTAIDMNFPTSTHYHNTSVNPAWASHPNVSRDGRVDDHIFYTEVR